ncbi:MAG TPA: RsmB/NOP family class I SAM-dependent RNA methyltransferase [Lacunisphaera sp.]|jgi:16S rRNA (cytosine967-C5)-methyltransferase|nr:RsmB/NOP family class I SAM-dependent RNA methyltransferase [Lacunisphaera sp.]
MNPSIAANQQRLFLEFAAALRPHVPRDSSLPRRIKEMFARNRAIGSRDRKLYRELVYTWLRYRPWIDPLFDRNPALAARLTAWLAPELKPTSAYRAALCADWPGAPATLRAKADLLGALLPGQSFDPASLLPGWFREHCPAAFTAPHLDALNRRANIWVRLQCNDHELVLGEFRARGWDQFIPDDCPEAVCLPPNAEVAGTDAYRRGFLEIQDLGSQLVLAYAPIVAGSRWLDACAGAGGKTLQLARLVGAAGQVDAADIRVDILDELRDRAQRARLANVRITNNPAGEYDGVLVDAPCSGSGTWRRQPHLKWYLTPESVEAFAQTQLEILSAQAARVKAGGLLVYATCSLSRRENHDVVQSFRQAHQDFAVVDPEKTYGGIFDGHGTTLLPGTRDTDGFYVAVLRRAPVPDGRRSGSGI